MHTGKSGTFNEAPASLGKEENKAKNNLTESMKTFYRELVEITLDFMSNNMFFDYSSHPQLTPTHNQNEFFVEVYSNPSISTNLTM